MQVQAHSLISPRDRVKATLEDRLQAQREHLALNTGEPDTRSRIAVRISYERNLRKLAEREGLALRKRGDRVWIVDPTLNCLIAGGDYGFTLIEAEEWLIC